MYVSKMAHSPWMLFSFLILIFFVSLRVASAKSFPDMESLADYSPINSSSTCGTPAIKVCRSSMQSSSLDVCTEDTCKFACCDSCSSSKPTPTDLGKGSSPTGITNGPSRPGSTDPSFRFASSSYSYMIPHNLGRAINYKTSGFTIHFWIKQKDGNKGTLYSKTLVSMSRTSIAGPDIITYKVIYHLEIENYKIWFHYQYEPLGSTSTITLVPLQSQHLKPNEWHLITVTVVSKYLSYFIDGQFIKATLLKGAIKDTGGSVRIGLRDGDVFSQYEGLMQDMFLYNIALTNREVMEAFSGVLPKVYIASHCRCPPDYPKVMESKPAKCTRNVDNSAGEVKLRLADTAHPIELATDGDTTTYWQSTLTDSATIYLDLRYGEMQIFNIILEFYGAQPSAIRIERSRDNGLTYKHWQYFAENCVKSFNMANNGRLPQPDSVNCLQYDLPLKSSSATISFNTEKAPPQGSSIPPRPFGSLCNNFHCSKKLLEFVKASHIKFLFFNHTLVKNDKHKYFGLSRIFVAGRCECFGHAKTATYIRSNATHGGKCVCQCDASTFTEGEKCDRCLPLYNKKPFQRGNLDDTFPCIKCECNQHATSCYYNKTLDPSPESRTQGGGGVCKDCQHNTTGRYCHRCKETFYRKIGKSLSALDACSYCACTGPGVVPNKLDCVKDDTKPGVSAGQCECKQFVQGRQCNRCKPGFYNFTALNRAGCEACACDPFGSLNTTVCNVITGQCTCKVGSTGRRCDKCDDGYHSLDAGGCKTCYCSKKGSALVNKCNNSNGQCYCKPYTEGLWCDRCKSGYFNISASNPDGCEICKCDPKGTLQCEMQSGNCTCKRYVTGKNCNQCHIGTYNLSLNNPEGCQRCDCNAKGTQNASSSSVLGCSIITGLCSCLSNVVGRRCDSCAPAYFWNRTGEGCVACNCNLIGSTNGNCNMTTGQCQCNPNIGGLRCDRCLPGNYGFGSGNCQPCGCNLAGVKDNVCDDSGKCTSCKANVEGDKCDTCKEGTVNLQSNNLYGCSEDVQHRKTNSTVKEGQDTRLNCSICGDGAAVWEKEGSEIKSSSSRVQIQGSYLVIKNASTSDAGIYKCIKRESRCNGTNTINLWVSVTIKVKMSLRVLNWNFTKNMTNKSSKEFKKFETNFKTQMDIVYRNFTGYQGVEILQLLKGSVRVRYRVIIRIQIKNKEQRTVGTRVKVTNKVIQRAKTGFVANLQVDSSPESMEIDSPPPAPQNVDISSTYEDGVSFTWDRPLNFEYFGIKEYLIEIWVTGQKSKPETTKVIESPAEVRGLKSETAYRAQVLAVNSNGNGEESETVEFKTAEGTLLEAWEIALIVLFCVIFIVIVVALIIICHRRRTRQRDRRRRQNQELAMKNAGIFNQSALYTDAKDEQTMSYTNPWYDSHKWKSFPKEDLVLSNKLGEGEFGTVYKGQLLIDGTARECAVKTLRDPSNQEAYRDLFKELELMANIGSHPNLVNLIGAVIEEGALYVIVEYAENGSLIEYLKKDDGGPPLDYSTRLSIALGVAKGMAFLEKRRCVHRDLAARNVLLDGKLEAKVADFGLSRDIYESGMYEKTTAGKLPTRWMPLESLEMRRFNSKTDVWSFGVLLWEIESGGRLPYGAQQNFQELLKFIKGGGRLEKPPKTTDELYRLMMTCWSVDPASRPSFSDIINKTLTIMLDNYLQGNHAETHAYDNFAPRLKLRGSTGDHQPDPLAEDILTTEA